MSHRRTPSDSKSTHNVNDSLNSTSSTNRASIYSIRTDVLSTQTSELDTDGNQQSQQDTTYCTYFTYCFYTSFQNLIHVHVIYVLFYHAAYWLEPKYMRENSVPFKENLYKTDYEKTLFVSLINDYRNFHRSPVNMRAADKYIYRTLAGISLLELFTAYIWTLQKKVYVYTCRYPKFRTFLSLLLSLIIAVFYLTYICWLYTHTFVTRHLSRTVFAASLVHLIILTFLDKPYLFCNSSTDLFSVLHNAKKVHRSFVCSTSLSPTSVSSPNRPPYRLTLPTQSRKVNSLFSTLVFSSRWWPVIEQKITAHQCSSVYADTRKEADELWSVVFRRILIIAYRTLASLIFFDIIPFKMINSDVRPVNIQQYYILVMIFTLATLLTQSIFLFPIEFQISLHHLATHLGRWRVKSPFRKNRIHESTIECNSHHRGSQIKYSSNQKEKFFIGEDYLNNAAHPQSISHTILYYLFHNRLYFSSKQFFLCIILVLCQLLWLIQGKLWYEVVISGAILLNNGFTIFQITRDRFIFDLMDDNEYNEISLKSKEEKIN
ncbi:unnamed protein product [Adineta ricciae]|uniref:Uncharacterized protein n=1 Tax=Adineta ricciae TaxID=249248 RepID=A0A814YMY6_ADIRI|nr:unnamed protein product [Adineta ricciae]CAF1540977.1 unnamed protein product [Adineta ricciae]